MPTDPFAFLSRERAIDPPYTRAEASGKGVALGADCHRTSQRGRGALSVEKRKARGPRLQANPAACKRPAHTMLPLLPTRHIPYPFATPHTFTTPAFPSPPLLPPRLSRPPSRYANDPCLPPATISFTPPPPTPPRALPPPSFVLVDTANPIIDGQSLPVHI